MNIRNFLKNPTAYFRRLPLSIVGIYFDLFINKYRTDGCSFVIPKKYTSLYERGKAFMFGYEAPERMLIKKYLPRNASVLELGGCIGIVACVINKIIENSNNHVVIEANKLIIPYLMENRDNNKCFFQIENALVSKQKQLKFSVHPNMLLSGIENTHGEYIYCEGITPMSLEEKYGIRFDFIVMDIEGAEASFFSDFSDFLAKNIRGIIFEEHPEIVSIERRQLYIDVLQKIGLQKHDQIGNVSYFSKAAA